MWSEKYRPKKLALMVGNEEARLSLHNWLKKWKQGQKPAFLLGPPGVGKTTAVYAVASECGYRVIELNASDVRTRSKMEAKLGSSIGTGSILGENRLIFLDEVDGIHGRQDFGGADFIQEFIQKSKIPLVMAANVEENQKVVKLMKKSELMHFRRIPPALVEMFIRWILKNEEIEMSNEVIHCVIKETEGEVRAAINSIQVVVSVPNTGSNDLMARRDTHMNLKECLNRFFGSENEDEAYRAIKDCDARPVDKLIGAYSSVVSSNLDSENMARALDAVSKADEVLGNIGRTQEWRLLRYFDRLLSHPLFSALKKYMVQYGEDEIPWNIKLRIWNESRAIWDLSSKIAKQYHVSRRVIVSMYLPYVCLVLYSNPDLRGRVRRLMGLDDSVYRVMEKEIGRMVETVKK